MDLVIIYYVLPFLPIRFVLDGLFIRFRSVLDYPQTLPDRLSTDFPCHSICPGTFWLARAASVGWPRRPFLWRLLIGRAVFGLLSYWSARYRPWLRDFCVHWAGLATPGFHSRSSLR